MKKMYGVKAVETDPTGQESTTVYGSLYNDLANAQAFREEVVKGQVSIRKFVQVGEPTEREIHLTRGGFNICVSIIEFNVLD